MKNRGQPVAVISLKNFLIFYRKNNLVYGNSNSMSKIISYIIIIQMTIEKIVIFS